jgi:hypothetical protein
VLFGDAWDDASNEDAHALVHPHVGIVDGFEVVVFIVNS